jgi:hypothetical protein
MQPPVIYNTQDLEILTDSGFRPFVGIVETSKNTETLRFDFEDGSHIEVTPNHQFITKTIRVDNNASIDSTIHAQSLQIGDCVCTMDGQVQIVNITPGNKQTTYDLIEVGDHKFKTNGVISHNCEFLSSDPLLIDSMVLAKLESNICEPIYEDMGWHFWQHIKPNRTYIISVDPATGTGEDFTTMQVFDYQDISTVAQFRSNTMSSPSVYASLKLMLNKIYNIGSSCYFSVENNGVGEGIIALYENDENIPDNCDFVSEEGSNRLGMRTEHKVKLRCCLTLKQMIEGGTLNIKSSTVLKELRSFVASKGSYSAMIGATDDLISGLLIMIRILGELASFDQQAFDALHSYKEVGNFKDIVDDSEDYDDNYEPDGMIL